MKALLVVLIALLLVVGAIVAVILFVPSDAPTTRPGNFTLGDPILGKQVAMRPIINCVYCHSDDGSAAFGPSFKGLYGSVVKYDDGSSVLLDDKAIRETLKFPNAKIMEGFEPRMPGDIDSRLSEDDRLNLLAYLRSIGAGK